ncbi:MAG TPA: TonB C-terminal domain-containing protein [Byssovorax sp.]|jgi:hypothetical protein
MAREVQIPLVLWISAALVFHFIGGEGTLEVAKTALDRRDLRELVKIERSELRPADTTFEVTALDAQPTTSVTQAEAPDKESDATDDKADPDADAKPKPTQKQPEAKPKDKDEAKAEAPKPEEKKPEPIAIPLPLAPAPPPPPMRPDGRIAVQQHVQKNQPDNKTAQRIADDANTVAEETMAKIRSHDQDMENPSPGSQKAMGPKENVGNSDKDKEAHSEDRKGRDDKAPGEAARASTSGTHSTPAHDGPKNAPPASVAPGVAGPKGNSAKPGDPLQAVPRTSPGGAGPTSPEMATADRGWRADPAAPGGDGSSARAGRRDRCPSGLPRENGRCPPFNVPIHVGSIGLGGTGTPGGPNTNLNQAGVVAAVGDEKLRQEREADGASRRGEHAGRALAGYDFKKYRAAIENYDPSVKPGDRTSLNAAAVPFAGYVNQIHNKIHPFFAERELDAMDRTGDKGVADQNMYAVAEIVLNPENGRIVRRGIVKSSGSTMYDIVVLKSIDSSAPYGKAPDIIVSPDGKVYLHWEFHRNREDACTTRNAYPIMKRATATPAAPKPSGTTAPKPPPKNSDDRTPGPMRPLRE